MISMFCFLYYLYVLLKVIIIKAIYSDTFLRRLHQVYVNVLFFPPKLSLEYSNNVFSSLYFIYLFVEGIIWHSLCLSPISLIFSDWIILSLCFSHQFHFLYPFCTS